MTMILKAAALAAGLSLIGTAALACGPDGCMKDKDGKPACCCEKMHEGHGGPKPGSEKPATPPADEHKDHKH